MGAPQKVVNVMELRPHFRDGMTLLFGGFLGVGTPDWLILAVLDWNLRDLTIIGNDTATPTTGIGRLVSEKRVRKAVVSHIGTNPETGRQMIAKQLEVVLVPQGTLVEQIRCGGAGLGGFLTPTGIGTIVEKDKPKLSFDGVTYLVERPIRADVALVKAKRADTRGNLVYERAARNFNPLIAMAADFTAAEVDEIVEPGAIDPDVVVTPGTLIDRLVLAGRR